MKKNEFEDLKIFGLEILTHLMNELNETEEFTENLKEKEKNLTQTCLALGLFAKKIQNKELFIDLKYKRILDNFEIQNGNKEKQKNGKKSNIKCPSCGYIQLPEIDYFILSFYKCKECQEVINKEKWNEVNLCKGCGNQKDVFSNKCHFCGFKN